MMPGHHSHGTPAKVRKSSPNSTKQGLMKATIPISSVFKNPNSLRHISPTLSPTSWKSRISPDHPSGQRSPGSTLYKGKYHNSQGINKNRGQTYEKRAALKGESQTSSPDQECSKLGTSPHINRFLAHEPPDGCEKVHLKSLDELKGLTVDKYPRPSTFQLKPSLGSAFQLLQPNINTLTDRDLPLVPSQQDSY